MDMAEIKAKLPDVKVEVNGEVFVGRVTGRINRFATVTIRHKFWGEHYLEFSWAAIKRAVNNNTVLKV